MKRIFHAIVICLLLGQSVNSQDFISEDKQWNVRDFFWGQVATEIFKIEGDSVLNSISYSKVWSTFDSGLTNFWFQGLIREAGNVVYFKSPYGSERILYDFNLEAGDTANVCNLYCDVMQVVVKNVDFVDYLGIQRKRWELEGWTEEYWVEGIGDLFGPFHTKFLECITDNDFSLLCFYQGNELRYIKENENDCFQTSVGIKEDTGEGNVILRPNPVIQGQAFEIQTDNSIKEICVFNTEGKLMMRMMPEAGKSIFIGTANLNAGLYLLRMTFMNDYSFSRKIIIR
jgi:hypothetical protein